MPGEFDPYLKWLAILPEEQPPNHYRLLGVPLFLDDADVIENAADQRMAHVRTFGMGEHSDLSQKILNEISAAKVLLLSPGEKAVYDEKLRAKQAPQKKRSEERPKPKTRTRSAANSAPTRKSQPSTLPGVDVTPRETGVSARVPRRKKKPVWQKPEMIAAGAVLVICIAGAAMILGGKRGPEASGHQAESTIRLTKKPRSKSTKKPHKRPRRTPPTFDSGFKKLSETENGAQVDWSSPLIGSYGAKAELNATYSPKDLAHRKSIVTPQQDNWIVFSGQGSATAETANHPTHSATTVIRASESVQLSRVSDAQFAYRPHDRTDTQAELIFDGHNVNGGDMVFGLGDDLALNTGGRLGPVFGFSGSSYFIRKAVFGDHQTASMPAGDDFGDWYRIKLVVDFTAFDGDGSGSMYVMNLTDGETEFREPPIFSDFNLGLLTMENGSQNPAQWNSIYIRLGAGNEAVNLIPNHVLSPTTEP